jgi:hypothetical protein
LTRGLSPSMLTGIARTDVRPILLFEGQFDGGFVRFWTGFGTISWNGSDWIGAGQLIGISDIEENAEVVATGITVSLSGVDPALVSAVIGEARQNMVGRIWIGLFDAGAIVSTPYLAFRGRLDVPQILDGDETCTIAISYENVLGDLMRAQEERFTDESQKAVYPDDRGFEFVTRIQDIEIVWTRN